MKIAVVLAGLLLGGYYIDSQYYHGKYVRAAVSMAQQVVTYIGLRR
jgi:hypothetical protein